MLQGTVQLVAAVGGVAFILGLGMYRYHNEPGLFAAISLVAWSMLAFGGDAVTVVTDAGNTVTQAQPAIQYLALGLALVSALAVVGSLSGKWPTGEVKP